MQLFIPNPSSNEENIKEQANSHETLSPLNAQRLPEIYMPMVDLSPDRNSEVCGGFIRLTVPDNAMFLEREEFKVYVVEVWSTIKNWIMKVHPTDPCLYLYLISPDSSEDNLVRNISHDGSQSRDFKRKLIKIFQQFASNEGISLFWVISANGVALVDAASIPNITPCIRFSEALLERQHVMESELIQRACWWLDQPDSTETWLAWRRFQRRMINANTQPNALLVNITDGGQIRRWFAEGVRRFAGNWPHSHNDSSLSFISYFEPHEVSPF